VHFAKFHKFRPNLLPALVRFHQYFRIFTNFQLNKREREIHLFDVLVLPGTMTYELVLWQIIRHYDKPYCFIDWLKKFAS